MGNSFGKQTHSGNVQPQSFTPLRGSGGSKRIDSKDKIGNFYCTDEDTNKSISPNNVNDIPDQLDGAHGSTQGQLVPVRTNSNLDQQQKDNIDKKEESTKSNRTKSPTGSLTNSNLDQQQKDNVDKEKENTKSIRTKSSSGSFFSSSKFDKKTVAPEPDKSSTLTKPSSVDLVKVSEEKRTASFYDNGVNGSTSVRYSEYDEHTVPQPLKMKSRQELAIQIQAMKDEVERLWTILTQQHLTHITSNQSASKCPFEFTEHIHDIEIYADGLKKTIDAIQHEKNSYINRLSSVAGSLLTDNNPNITDLNDPNRPTKLAEKLGKIYDDEWTDAVQGLEQKKSKKKEKRHEKIVYHLYSLIKVLYVTCKQKAEEQVGHFLLLKDPSQYQVEASWTEIPVESRKSFTENRKQIAEANIEMLQKIIKDDDIYKKEICSLSPSLDDKILEYLQNSLYFKKCLEICWYFVIQDPPLYLDIRPLEGNLLNKDTHKEYTKSGSTIKYAVWPALYLHCTNNEKGPLLAKGVVQPKARKPIGAISEEDLLQNH